MKLGLFEIGESHKNLDDLEVIENTIELAKLADELGYHRFWMGEHHESGVAWRSPEILMTVLAGYTNKIKIGAAGVLLSLNSPLRVAQNFKMLGALFSGRIDLGIARGFTTDDTALALLNGLDYKDLIKEHIPRAKMLLNYLREPHTIQGEAKEEILMNVPINGSLPDIWMLGTSGTTTDFSINEQLNFALSLLHTPNLYYEQARDIFVNFLNKYENVNLAKPLSNITISMICAETVEDRDEILRQHKGNFTINVIGNVNTCYEKILSIGEDFKTDEVLLHILSPDFKAKISIVEQIAEKFQLSNALIER